MTDRKPTEEDYLNYSDLLMAAQFGDLITLTELMLKYGRIAVDCYGKTALHYAANGGQ